MIKVILIFAMDALLLGLMGCTQPYPIREGMPCDCAGTQVCCSISKTCIEASRIHRCPNSWSDIEAGSFWMGSPGYIDNPPSVLSCPEDYTRTARGCVAEEGHEPDENLHFVFLTQSFAMQRHEVTQAAFQALMSWNPSQYQSDGQQLPVESVTWFDAILYANKLSRSAGLPPCYEITNMRCAGPSPDPGSAAEDVCAQRGLHTVAASVKLPDGLARYDLCPGYRLPTEAEWEYAARAGTLGPYSPKDLSLIQLAWFSEPSRLLTSPAEVASLQSNDHNLFDMFGNLEEWVWDPYQIFRMSETVCDEYGDYCPLIDPMGERLPLEADDLPRVIKGGSWRSSGPGLVRAGTRSPSNPGIIGDNRGFRLVRTLINPEAR